ncbi:[protein-PII] uridylyltransferase [Sphingomonas sp.]|uniref:[protein-PII] uridylyltransferase n=1 Tax=Sphingomonas sp. TaxID=28214 RepID=UPI0025ED3ACD|nr:[protein-PII] uridylyltransferase [Sphingomonas sp.]MBV9528771.1 [protein-PII] uridylyltransferase [Sphingomonas sp.]
MTSHDVENRRAIIDRRAVAERMAGGDAAAVLREALDAGRAEVAERLARHPGNGRAAAHATAFLHDQIVRLAFEHVAGGSADTAGLTLVALGGSGRGEMAPYSDLDLMVLTAKAPMAEQGASAQALFHLLWELKLKVGHSVRSLPDLLQQAKTDMTVRTAMLEARALWGDSALFDLAIRRFRKEVVSGTAAEFVAAKLAERDQRHIRMGDSRYVVEPNVKDGKGGLRDLHTLYWIGKYVHGVERPSDLVGAGLLSAAEFRRFDRAERFFWSVRCHLHLLAGRAEERVGFAYQPQIAGIMHYADRPGKSAVERFMQFYFLNAKTVGDLTGVFLAQLDEQLGKKGFRFALPTIRRRPGRLSGFTLDRGRISIPNDDFFRKEPVRLLELFALAARERLEVHPAAMRAATRDSALIGRKVRDDPRANALFLDVLTSLNSPEIVLRWMNETGVFGRFVPDFGRVVAQMQFDMYHHYTVDEHSIRALGLLAAIERGDLRDDHPLSTALFRQIGSRRVLYVAVLLHDIAKGRGGDHSEMGAEIALRLCPRLGLDAAETETVAWLVRHHLLMSSTAFKRDLADAKTIEDFVRQVQSPERLRLLLILTVVDIRAVGPTIWNEWKRVLLRTLFEAAEERLRLGHKQHGRAELVQDRQAELGKRLGWKASAVRAHGRRLPDSYWLAEPLEWQVANARQVAAAEARIGEAEPTVVAETDADSNATRVTVFSPDREGLFYRICAGLAAAGANIIDARIHTTRDGMALDNLLVHDAQGRAYADRRLRGRLVRSVEKALGHGAAPALPSVEAASAKSRAFIVAPSVSVADQASTRTTVVEVHALDRPALLARLAGAIVGQGHRIHSAHIATYGERAVDVFYLTNADGRKLDAGEVDALRSALLEAAMDSARAEAA